MNLNLHTILACKKGMTRLNNQKQLKTYRRKLRTSMTPAEVALWSMIKNRQLNKERFLRQYSIGHFIVDFYCPKYKLAIELDGEIHNDEDNKIKDTIRTEYLNSLGIKVIRFENFEVFKYPERTLNEIKQFLK